MAGLKSFKRIKEHLIDYTKLYSSIKKFNKTQFFLEQIKYIRTYILIFCFDRDSKDMKANQAKVSVDTAKDVQADPSLKTKAEKDRRLR